MQAQEPVTKGQWTASDEPGTETRLALWIRLGNEEMQTLDHVADALLRVINRMHDGHYDGTIRDINGNTVGAWDIEAFQH